MLLEKVFIAVISVFVGSLLLVNQAKIKHSSTEKDLLLI